MNKKGFPNYKGWWIFRKPNGWKDLGRCRSYKYLGKPYYDYHAYCGKRPHIGKQGEELFKFCPLCMIKVFFPIEKEEYDENRNKFTC